MTNKFHPKSEVESPVAWFVMLEQARVNNDFEAASNAKRKLEALGVFVSYRKAPVAKELTASPAVTYDLSNSDSRPKSDK